jgi:hypothetical protein
MNPRRLLLPGPLPVRAFLWFLVFVVFPFSVTTAALSFQLEVLGGTTVVAHPVRSATLDRAERVLVYLEQTERKEIDPWLRDDIRIAWITTLYASRGNSQPHIDATYRVLGCHPDQVWERILERRKAQCGSLYAQVWGGASSPKKPVQSEKSVRLKSASRKDLAA